MKYIRTKDGISGIDQPIQPERELQTEWIDDHLLKVSWKTKPCEWKQADTIEELCDEFVLWFKELDKPTQFEDFETAKKYIKAKVYGAIWTDKGLIYVAKMNDEGELELL